MRSTWKSLRGETRHDVLPFFPAVVRMWVLPNCNPSFTPSPVHRATGKRPLGLERTRGQPHKTRNTRKIRSQDYEEKPRLTHQISLDSQADCLLTKEKPRPNAIRLAGVTHGGRNCSYRSSKWCVFLPWDVAITMDLVILHAAALAPQGCTWAGFSAPQPHVLYLTAATDNTPTSATADVVTIHSRILSSIVALRCYMEASVQYPQQTMIVLTRSPAILVTPWPRVSVHSSFQPTEQLPRFYTYSKHLSDRCLERAAVQRSLTAAEMVRVSTKQA